MSNDAKGLFDGLFKQAKTELVQGFEHLQDYVLPLTGRQIKGIALLRQLGMHHIADQALELRKTMAGPDAFLEFTDKLTLGDRIKGNARLANVVRNGDQSK